MGWKTPRARIGPGLFTVRAATPKRCATVGGASQPVRGPVRRRGRAVIRFATLLAPGATPVSSRAAGAFMLGGEPGGHGWLGPTGEIP